MKLAIPSIDTTRSILAISPVEVERAQCGRDYMGRARTGKNGRQRSVPAFADAKGRRRRLCLYSRCQQQVRAEDDWDGHDAFVVWWRM
jgi:hypothetical protein